MIIDFGAVAGTMSHVFGSLRPFVISGRPWKRDLPFADRESKFSLANQAAF